MLVAASGLLTGPSIPAAEEPMGRILLGVVIGVILVVWLLVSCLTAIF